MNPRNLIFFERTPDGLITHSTSSKLFEKRIIMLSGVIEPIMTDDLIGGLLLLNYQDESLPIDLWIHSPGGYIDCLMAIIDTMNFISAPCHTYAMGQVASAASVILAAGAKGNRFALPGANIMIHQPAGGAQGQASDIIIEAKEILKLKERLNQMLSEYTGQPLDVIERDADRNFYMTAQEAVEYGIVDAVIQKRP